MVLEFVDGPVTSTPTYFNYKLVGSKLIGAELPISLILDSVPVSLKVTYREIAIFAVLIITVPMNSPLSPVDAKFRFVAVSERARRLYTQILVSKTCRAVDHK